MPAGSQVPSTVTGRPSPSPGYAASGPSTESSGTGDSRVTDAALSARWSCHTSYCQRPRSTVATTAASISRWTPQ